ncbi:MAG TPA: ABC transporter ATP-binding protein [Flexilinea sp.]|jgi:branched-chain amino acid transport system ATP-binding protein|nr:ABC transporter ATP-binding protein [Flexilinea sp.]OQA27847.1 MAG: Lipopolysaccharide export system ATP-binding protein LptB [Chloroflexi bacterium ADurb.Bin344]HNY93311.1 ABC transporter ATP-binding protein [Flexilinea sp.]HOG21128.1 ABC transporter ATP-binding protein [Flexilinea sp.]HOG60901.1 ABC transporter ATP-binding protein [Flexilinea sp.]
MTPILEAKNLTMRFGGLTSVSDFNLTMEKGELVGLIGPNGAGKSTVFNMICGFYKPTIGEIIFDGKNITGMKPYRIANMGLIRVFQNGRLFKNMNVIENMMVSKHMRFNSNSLKAILRTPSHNREEQRVFDESVALLERIGLKEMMYEPTGKLPFGIQRKLEVARALCANPSLLLLDEPVAGLNVEETNDMMNFVDQLRNEFGITILLIEHTMRVVMSLCPKIIVIDHGETIAVGIPDEIRNNKRVIEAYLGVDEQ